MENSSDKFFLEQLGYGNSSYVPKVDNTERKEVAYELERLRVLASIKEAPGYPILIESLLEDLKIAVRDEGAYLGHNPAKILKLAHTRMLAMHAVQKVVSVVRAAEATTKGQ